MPSVSEPDVDLCCLSDPGREPSKQINEDSGCTAATGFGRLALVCDGMGGHAHGQAASQAAVNTILDRLGHPRAGDTPASALVQAIQAANYVVHEQGGGPSVEARPGTTCVALLIHAGGAEIAHVGDSRAYLVRQGQIYRMTRDHSVVQQMLDAGMLTPEQAVEHPESNRITRALGMAPTVEVELRARPFALATEDFFVLASDGLTDLVTDQEILSIVSNRRAEGLAMACQALIDMANLRGGHDNITVIGVRVLRATTSGVPLAAQGYATAPFTGPKTVVDGSGAPTHVDPSPPHTLDTLDSSPQHAPPLHAPPLQHALPQQHAPPLHVPPQQHVQPQHAPLQPGAGYPGPHAPAFAAEVGTARTTEPGLVHGPFGAGQVTGRFMSEYPGRVAKLSRNGKILLLLAALFTVCIVGAIVLWWIVATLSAPGTRATPPEPKPLPLLESGSLT